MTDLPIACTLNTDELRQRRADLLPGLLARAVAREMVHGGMQFRFDASSETLAELCKVVDAERQCCRFLRFELTVAADLGPMTLTVTGPAGTREFLEGILQEPGA